MSFAIFHCAVLVIESVIICPNIKKKNVCVYLFLGIRVLNKLKYTFYINIVHRIETMKRNMKLKNILFFDNFFIVNFSTIILYIMFCLF